MIPAGLVNALVAWATNTDPTVQAARIAQLTAERDALVSAFLSGGKPSRTMTSAGGNGKSFAFLSDLTREDKLSVLTSALVTLGAIDPPETLTYGNFAEINR